MDNTNASTQNDQSLANIDAACAAAEARKAAKLGTAIKPNNAAPAPKRVAKTSEQRLAEAAQREKDRDARKAARAAERDAKKAARPAPEPAHMKKVAKAAERLPSLDAQTVAFFDDAKAALTSTQLSALAAHIGLHCRASATVESTHQKFAVGDAVTIVTTDVPSLAKFIGLTGTLVRVNRIRVYVQVPGTDKPVYLFASDVRTAAPAVPTENAPEETAAAPEA